MHLGDYCHPQRMLTIMEENTSKIGKAETNLVVQDCPLGLFAPAQILLPLILHHDYIPHWGRAERWQKVLYKPSQGV